MNDNLSHIQQTYLQSLRDMEFDNRVHQAEQQLINDIISVRWDLCPLNSERDVQRGERRQYKSVLSYEIWKAINTSL